MDENGAVERDGADRLGCDFERSEKGEPFGEEVESGRKRLLVTGAGGFCGSHAVRHFAQAGWEVIAGTRPGSPPFWADPARRPEWFAPSGGEPEWLSVVAVEALDLSEQGTASLAGLLRRTRPDAVLHLAGLNAAGPSWTDPFAYMDTNLMGTVRLLEAIRASGHPCRIVVAGSMLSGPADGPLPAKPLHPYALSKGMQAQAALAWHALYGLDALVAVPSNLVGPGPSAGLSRLLARYAAACEHAAASQKCGSATADSSADSSASAPNVEAESSTPPLFRLSSAAETRDFLDVRDAMRGYETLLERGAAGSSYAMASGVMTPLGQLAELYRELAHVPLPMDIGGSLAASPDPADASALRALGWSPRIPLRESARDTLEDSRAAGRS
ncbi:NAD(P)-dependent oxidoreductase [Paenibacillus albicereus]|uniref:NAD(P)-dependent oxidoreductase n=1 Tax=Paenibacillus albicereus TaxID=2726185 RepID=A0A6H2GVM8_9BACL|nr:NAD(P)-dependent oxidoreductase [Paenibacillus albicereus]QJC51409.1 NAD(P)-dependent oxidoreductase [Paenibacillus albicereus]